MNDFFSAIILGIVEGITEFLPVSSTGHLILVNQWIGFTDQFEKMFDVVIQLGAILAVVIFFWKRLWPFGKSLGADERTAVWNTWFKVIVAMVPAVVIGAAFGSKIKDHLFNPIVVACALAVWGLFLIVIEKISKKVRITSIAELGFSTAFLIGLIQCLAMVPGTSRSAATIIGAMILGSSRLVAAEFSFFLAVPTMCAASAYSLYKYGGSMTTHQAAVLAVGFVVSFIVALGVIAAFMKFIQRRNFIPFGIYRIILGAAVLVYFFVIK
ncbi:MAG TPA: undecaprenyl-diphosphate phosphatase [Spirochaetota bacterium]